ncbi:MAG: serine/threonine-protein kinase [Phoenicibacter congonensis]|uniref:non-specific serine/threonine protein kinase n=1 Tax=Phoenicibacter congonensis TaxID=1944646 RepID=A0AA43U9R6_9ACTN|nr:serine/threonine-protein kinase [Phoenicibacter congonensis]
MTEALVDETLDAQLAAFDEDSEWLILETLKQTPTEATQVVVKISDATQPKKRFIRKEFADGSKQGAAYERVWAEQCSGNELSCCPKIVDFYKYGTTRVVILEYAEGETLEQFIKSNTLSEDEIKRLFLKICDAVQELHTAFDVPLIHRDLKPTNIIVSDGEVRIIDLGIARFERGDSIPDTTQLGTPAFAPPEQYGFGETNAASDIYSLGMVFYFMLTKKLSSAPLRDNPQIVTGVPPEFLRVLLKSTAFDPKQRYSSVTEMKKALGALSKRSAKKSSEKKPVASANKAPAQVNKTNDAFKNTYAFKVVGRVWNVCVTVVWLLMFLAGVLGIFNANGEFANRSLTYRLVADIGIIIVPVTIWAFVLFDKSRLKKKHPRLEKYTFGWLLLLAFIGFVIMLAAGFITAYAPI